MIHPERLDMPNAWARAFVFARGYVRLVEYRRARWPLVVHTVGDVALLRHAAREALLVAWLGA